MDKRNVSRREFLRLSATLAAGTVLAACAPSATEPASQPTVAVATEAPAEEVVNLEYWHGWAVEHERAAMEAAVQLFDDAHPNIKVEPISGKTNDQVLTAVSGGTPPNVCVIWSTQTLAQWAESGVITDLDDLVKGTGLDESRFYEAALEVSKYENKWYGLPIEIDASAVYYNKGLFSEAGLDPEKPPETIEELFQFGEKMTVEDDAGNVTQLGFSAWIDEAIVYMYDGQWWDQTSGVPTANAAANIEAWTAMADYYQNLGAERINTFNSQQAENPLGSLFLVGKVAMALDGDWVTAFMPRFAPDIEWGLFALPPAAAKPDTAFSTPVDGSIYVVPTGAQHPAEDWEFVRWMGTSKEASCLLQTAWANASPLLDVAKDSGCLPNEPYQVFLDIMSHDKMRVWPPIAVSAFYATERATAAEAVQYGNQSPKEALDALQSKVEQELQKAQS